MQFRQLGKNGPEVSAIGLGTWPIGGGLGHVEEQQGIAVVRAAIDSGITLLDTAQSYYTSEDTLGKALKDGYRERCFLCTKVGSGYSRNDIQNAMDNSLRGLGVDHVDLYQIHDWKSEYPIDKSMEAMARLQEQGKTRFIGVSNFNAEQMRLALQTAPFQSNQPRYNMFSRRIEPEDIPFCEQEGIGILPHSPLSQGLLTGTYAPGHLFPEDDARSRKSHFQGEKFASYLASSERLKDIATEKGVTLIQLALAWILRLPAISCVLVGAKTTEQLREHIGAADVVFSQEELDRIDSVLASAPKGL